MVKSEEYKLKRDDDPMCLGLVKLPNKETKEKTPCDIAPSPSGKETSTKKVIDLVLQDIPKQDATSCAHRGGKGKEKTVEPVVQVKLQDRIIATKKAKSAMVKPEEYKLKIDDDPMFLGLIKLPNKETKEKTPCGEKTDIATSPSGKETSTKNVIDLVLQDILKQDATSCAHHGGKGKKKAVEPVVQFKLQDRIIAAAATTTNGKRISEIYFELVASKQENTVAPLKQVPSPYIKIKNNDMQLSIIKQLLVMKLGLNSENEIELYLGNELLDPSIVLFDLWHYWISTKRNVKIRKLKVGSSAAKYIMKINYGRKSGL